MDFTGGDWWISLMVIDAMYYLTCSFSPLFVSVKRTRLSLCVTHPETLWQIVEYFPTIVPSVCDLLCLGSGRFWPYPPGLLHWHRGTHDCNPEIILLSYSFPSSLIISNIFEDRVQVNEICRLVVPVMTTRETYSMQRSSFISMGITLSIKSTFYL